MSKIKSGYSVILSSLRRERNLSQRKVSEDLGISQALLSHYENGVREPRFDFVVRACDYYGVSADYFFGRTKEKTYDDKVFFPCSDTSLHEPLTALSELISGLENKKNADISSAAAGCLSVFFSNMLSDLNDPNAPYSPERDAKLKLAQAALLSALRAITERN